MDNEFDILFKESDEVASEEVTILEGVIEQTIQLQEEVNESLATVKRLIGDKDRTENYLKTVAPISLWRNNEYLVWNVDAYINEHKKKQQQRDYEEQEEKKDFQEKFDFITSSEHSYSKQKDNQFQNHVNKYLMSYNRMNTEKIKIKYALESALKINQRALRVVDCESESDDDELFISSTCSYHQYHSLPRAKTRQRAMSASLHFSSSPRPRTASEHITCNSNLRPAFSTILGKSPGFGSPKPSPRHHRRYTMTSSENLGRPRSALVGSGMRISDMPMRMMESCCEFSSPQQKVLMRSQYIKKSSTTSSPKHMRKFGSEFILSSSKQTTKSMQKCRY